MIRAVIRYIPNPLTLKSHWDLQQSIRKIIKDNKLFALGIRITKKESMFNTWFLIEGNRYMEPKDWSR